MRLHFGGVLLRGHPPCPPSCGSSDDAAEQAAGGRKPQLSRHSRLQTKRFKSWEAGVDYPAMTQSTPPPRLPPPGWYPDPEGDGLRRWDGAQWTDERSRNPSLGRLAPTSLVDEGRREAERHRIDAIELEHRGEEIHRELRERQQGDSASATRPAVDESGHKLPSHASTGAASSAHPRLPIEERIESELGRVQLPPEALTPPKRPPSAGRKVLTWLVALAVIGTIASIAGISAGGNEPVSVLSHSCTSNSDGSVHVQGRLRNTSDSSKATVVEFILTLRGGQTETSRPLGGYSVPGQQASLVGEDLNVPPGAEWVDCTVEVVG